MAAQRDRLVTSEATQRVKAHILNKKKYTEKEKVKKTLTGILHLMSKESSDTDGEEENWIDYIKRSTREVEHKLMKCNISNLVVTLGELQLRHAQTIADHGKKGWTLIFLV